MPEVRTLNRQDAWEMWQEGFPEDSEAFFGLFWEKRSEGRISLGLYDADRVVSALHLIPQTLSVRGVPVPAMMVAGVSTRQDLRRRGYAFCLMREAETRMLEEGIPVAFLDPFLEAFYRPLGYETGTWFKDLTVTEEGDADRITQIRPEEMTGGEEQISGVSVIRSQSDQAFRLADLMLENGSVWQDNRTKNCLMATEEDEKIRVLEHHMAPDELEDAMKALCARFHEPVLCRVSAAKCEPGCRHGVMFLPILIEDLIGRIPRKEGEAAFCVATRRGNLAVRLSQHDAKTEKTQREAQITDTKLFSLMIGAEEENETDDPLVAALQRIYPPCRSLIWEQY